MHTLKRSNICIALASADSQTYRNKGVHHLQLKDVPVKIPFGQYTLLRKVSGKG